MKQIFLLLFFSISLLAGEKDTTYSKYKPVAKQKTSTGTSRSSRSSSASSGTRKSPLGQILSALLQSAIKDSHKKSGTKFSSNGLLYGVGIGGAGEKYEFGSGGLVQAPLSLYYMNKSPFSVRASVTPTLQFSKMEANFTRDIYVNGIKSGEESVVTDRSTIFSVPVTGDLLLSFFCEGFVNLIIGGGVQAHHERMSTLVGGQEEIVRDNSWAPVIRGGVGFVFPVSKRQALFMEFLVSNIRYRDTGTKPLVSDVAEESVQLGGAITFLF